MGLCDGKSRCAMGLCRSPPLPSLGLGAPIRHHHFPCGAEGLWNHMREHLRYGAMTPLSAVGPMDVSRGGDQRSIWGGVGAGGAGPTLVLTQSMGMGWLWGDLRLHWAVQRETEARRGAMQKERERMGMGRVEGVCG